MFDILVNLFTASAMLVHSILGCCSHHAHVCEHGHVAEQCQHEGDDANEPIDHGVSESVHHSCGHHHHHSGSSDAADATAEAVATSDQPSECPHEPCDHSCDGESCVFASQFEKVEIPSADQETLVDRVSIPSASLACDAGQNAAQRNGEAEPTGMLTACRCRLLTQIWLL